MKLAVIRQTTEQALQQAGFAPGSFVWVPKPNRLNVIVAGKIRTLPLRGGMSKCDLMRMIGKIEGYAEALRAA